MVTSGDDAELERRFESAMYEIYERAGRELKYWATRYLQMLRARGGLDTARYLLHQKATSAGYQTLRDAGRLDLTVEAYVLCPEFQPLFTADELNRARDRLEYYGRLVEETRPSTPPDPALLRLLDEARAARPEVRVELHRDRIAAFGASAIPAVEAWVLDGGSVGFACRCSKPSAPIALETPQSVRSGDSVQPTETGQASSRPRWTACKRFRVRGGDDSAAAAGWLSRL